MPSRKVVPISSPTSTLSPVLSPVSSKTGSQNHISQHYDDINVIKLLSKAKFSVYLAFSPSTNTNLALKIFPFEGNMPHPYFKNEARFSCLKHQNIINTIYAQEDLAITSGTKDSKASCLLMEYAPYGDLFDFVKLARSNLTEKLTRTYFRQLIEGIEYLHKNNVCHFDLKLENLLIGEDYQLKIADFDLSYMKGDSDLLTFGTKYYRAPELRAGKSDASSSADIYSVGIILFVMKCGGVLPHTEDEAYKGTDLMGMLSGDPEKFFNKHCAIQGRESSFFDSHFKELFISMVREDPAKRLTIKAIKKSKWYKGPVYTCKELEKKMRQLLGN